MMIQGKRLHLPLTIFSLLGILISGLPCLSPLSSWSNDRGKAETVRSKHRVREFRPLIPTNRTVEHSESQTKPRAGDVELPISRKVDHSGSSEKGRLTISTPGLIPPPPIPTDPEETVSDSSELKSVVPETGSPESMSDARFVSQSDLPPDEKRTSPGEDSSSTPPEPKKKEPKASHFKPPTSIAEISGPPTLENLRASAHVLAREGLKYKFGRDDPKQGGLDCSGVVQYLLTKIGIKNVPRTSYDQYDWLKNKHLLDDVYGKKASTKLFEKLSPGELIFWGNTWHSGHRVSHVMLYLGWDPETEKHYVFGAQSKSSKGILGNGVDVFELEPNRGRLIAHGKIPGLKYGVPIGGNQS